jgi:hypothetical protein
LRFAETYGGAIEPKHERKKQVIRRKRLVKVEMQFFCYFFSALAKKVREEIILVFIFWHRPKNETNPDATIGTLRKV